MNSLMTPADVKNALDLAAGLALLEPDYSERIRKEMVWIEHDGHPSELIHVLALAIAATMMHGTSEPWMAERWEKLSHAYDTQ